MSELHDFFDRYPITPDEVLGQADHKRYIYGSATTLSDVGLTAEGVLGQADYKRWLMKPLSFDSLPPVTGLPAMPPMLGLPAMPPMTGLPAMPPRNPFLC